VPHGTGELDDKIAKLVIFVHVISSVKELEATLFINY
jgi:hypothetical protein